MNKLMILALLVAVFSIMIDITDSTIFAGKNRASGRKHPTGICGGCGCNIFNCNCDWTPQECGACQNCRATFWDAIPASIFKVLLGRKKRSLEVGEYMDFDAADLDGNGFMDRVEYFLAYERLVLPNEYLEAEFLSLDVNQDGFISRIEAGVDS